MPWLGLELGPVTRMYIGEPSQRLRKLGHGNTHSILTYGITKFVSNANFSIGVPSRPYFAFLDLTYFDHTIEADNALA